MMKHLRKLWVSVVTIVALTIPMGLKSQNTLTVADGTATNNYVPIYGLYVDDYLRCQMIYPASMLNEMSGGVMTSMTFFLSTPATDSWGSASFTINIAEVADSTFPSYTWLTPTFTQVYAGSLDGTDSVMTITFSTPYVYSGGNLLVEVNNMVEGTWKSASFYGISSYGSSLQGHGSNWSSITGSSRDFIPKTRFAYTSDPNYCPTPGQFVARDVTASAAVLSWHVPGVFTNTSDFTVEYGEYGFTPGSGTSLTVTDDSLLLTGLTEGTRYEAYVYTNCTTNQSITAHVIFTTHAMPVTDMPYGTGFEEGDDMAWEFNNGNNGWFIDTAAHTSGTTGMYISNDGGATNAYTISSSADSYAYREFELTTAGEYTLSFDWHGMGESSYDYMYVYLASGNTDMSNPDYNEWTRITPSFLNQSAEWQTAQFTFDVETAGNYYLVFRWRNDGSVGTQPAAAVDNISFGPLTCMAPVNFVVNSVSTTSATVSWTGRSAASLYEVVVNDSIIDASYDTTYTLTDVIPGASYSLRIRAICGDEDTSFVLAGRVAIPMAEPVDQLPYSTGFEDGEDIAWSFTNGTNAWYIDTAVYHGGSHSLYISNDSAATNFYNTSTLAVSYAYRDIIISEAGQYAFSFDWKAQGESMYYDYLRVWLAPAGFSFTANQLPDGSTSCNSYYNVTPNDWLPLDNGRSLNQQSSWQTQQSFVNITTPGAYTIIFAWANDGSGGSQPPAAIDNVVLSQLTCPQPTALTIDTVDAESITLSWTAGGNESEWALRINGGDWQSIATNPYVVTGLNPSTAYNFELVAVCGSGDTSFVERTSGRTACGAITILPWTENFDGMATSSSATDIPCWNHIGGGYVNITSSYSTSGNGLRFYPNGDSEASILVLPEFQDPISNLEISFNTRPEGDGSGSIGVGYITDLNNDSTFVELAYYPVSYFPTTSTWMFIEQHFASAPDGARIALRHNPNSTSWYWFIDDVDVHVIPTCLRPANLVLDTATDNSLSLSWDDTLNSNATYYVEYRQAGSDIAWTGEDAYTNEIDLVGLDPNTAYEVRVRSLCGGDDTSLSVSGTFRTACGDIVTLPWVENFDAMPTTSSATDIPCWNHLGGGYVNITSGYSTSGNGLRFYPNSSSTPSILVLPIFADPISGFELTFNTRPEGSSSGSISVGYITDVNVDSTFVELANYPVSYFPTTSTWMPIDQTFAGAPDGARIALRHNPNSTSWYWFIDDIDVHIAPSCLRPSAVSVTGTTCQSISVNVTGEDGATYRYYITDGIMTDSVDMAVNTYTFTGLSDVTTYTVSVATLCDDGTITRSVSATASTTICGTPVPYSTGFETGDDVNWQFSNGSQTNKWVIDTAVSNAGSHALYISNDDGVTNNYTVSSTSSVYTYKAFNFGPGQYVVSYDWQAAGESTYDYLRVFMTPANATFDAGSSSDINASGAPSGWIALDGGSRLNQGNGWQTQTEVITIADSTVATIVFYWHNDGSVGTQPPAAIDNFQIAPLSCSQPLNLTVDSTTTTEAYLSWTAGSETEWSLSVDDGPWQSIFSNPYTVSSLSPSTTHTFALRAVCGADDTSFASTTSATTACAAITTLPWTENFDGMSVTTGATDIPCWNHLGGGYVNITSSYSTSGNGLRFYPNGSSTPSVLVLPEFDSPLGNLELSFNTRPEGSSSGSISVGYITDVNADSSFVELANYPVSYFPTTSTWMPIEQTFTAAPDGARIALRHNPYSTSWYWFIDDVDVHQAPACPRVTGLVATSVLSDEITVSYSGSAASYRLIISSDLTTDTVNVPDTVYTFIGLTPMTAYTISVESDCGTGEFAPAVSISATTTMVADPLPYSTGFEPGQDTTWMLLNGTATNAWYIGSAVSNGGTNALYISNDTGATNNYDITSTSNVFAYKTFTFDTPGDYVVSYDWNAYGESSYDYIRVFLVPGAYEFTPDGTNGISTSSAPAGWLPLDGGSKLNLSSGWQSHQEVFSVTTATNYQLVFFWHNDYSAGTQPPAAIDNIQIAMLSCPAPTAFTVEDATTSTITFSWTPMGAESQWEVTVDGVTSMVTTPFFTAMGLASSTSYDITVRAVCGDGDTSFALVGIASTDCDDLSFPYTESFEQPDAPAPCWTLVYGDDNPSVNTMIHTTDAYITGIRSFRFSSYSNTDTYDQYLVTPHISAADSVFVSFFYSKYSTYGDEFFQVGYSTSATATSFDDYVWGEIISPSTRYTDSAWDFFSANFPPATQYVAIHYLGDYEYYLYIDDFTISTTAAVCSAPVITAVTADEVSATVNWTGSADTYQVVCVAGSWVEPASPLTFTASPYTFTGLTPATTYTVAVRALCSDSLHSAWTFRTVTTADRPCTAPATVTANNVTVNSADISWTPAEADQSHFELHVFGTSFDQYFTVDSATAYTVTGLANNTAYTASVRTACAPGYYSSWSDSITFTTTTCQPVTGVSVTNITNYGATVSWNASPNSNGSYEVEYGFSGFSQGTGNRLMVSNTSYTISGLDETTLYDVYVRTVCAEGVTSAWSTVTSFTTLADDPNVTRYEVTLVYAPEMGTVAGSGSYVENTTATVTATANLGYHFVAWYNGDVEVSTANPYTFTVTADITLTAVFEVDAATQYTVTGLANDATMGTVLGSGIYNEGAIATLTATANPGYHFVSWMNGSAEVSTANPYAFTVTADITLTAIFVVNDTNVNYYTLTAVANDPAMGTVTGSNQYAEGATATLTATPNDGYEFVNWSNGATTPTITVVVTSDTVLTAYFQLLPCAVPTSLVINEVTSNSTLLSWTSDASHWEVSIYKTSSPNDVRILSVDTNPFTITGLEADTYYDVRVRAICSDDNASAWSATVTFMTTSHTDGIDDVDASQIALYPNPASTMVTLSGIEHEATVTLVDINGRVTSEWRTKGDSFTFDVSGMAQGTYFVRITGEHSTVIRKLIVK